jgi:hypothetical protein
MIEVTTNDYRDLILKMKDGSRVIVQKDGGTFFEGKYAVDKQELPDQLGELIRHLMNEAKVEPC